MNRKVIVLIIVLFAIVRVLNAHLNYSNDNFNKYINTKGKITYIKKGKNKTIIDVVSNIKIRVTLYKKTNYKLGDIIHVVGYIKNAPDNNLFNNFNYNKHLLSKKIKCVSINPKVKLISRSNNPFYILKNNIIYKIKKYKSYKYLCTFILGDKNYIDETIKNNYKDIGIAHLFSISGMHIGMILLVINFIFKNSRVKPIVIFLFLLLFLFLTNYTESLLRCFVFISLK